MSIEGLKSFFDLTTVVLLFLTFAVGAGALFTTNILNKRQAEELRRFDTDLTSAKTDLGKQQERAAEADSKLAGLQKDAADAKAEMAKQQARAATAERRLLELQERIQHRHLTSEQRRELVRRLKLSPKGSALLTCPVDDNEACDFLGEIGTALTEAGWTVSRDIPRIFHEVPPSLEFSIRNNTEANPPVEALDEAFGAIGLKIVRRAVDHALPPLTVRILVGRKPEKVNQN